MTPPAPSPVACAFLLDDPDGASARVRVHDRLAGLAAAGVAAEVVPLPRPGGGRRRAIARAARAEVVVLARRLLGEGDLVALRRAAPALVLDLDDALWLRPPGRGGALGRAWSAWRGRARLAAALRAADLVVAGSAALRDEARRRGHPRVRLVPPTTPPPPSRPRTERPTGVVRLVWTGSAGTRPYLEALDGVLAAAAARAAAGGVDLRLDVVADAPARLPAAGARARFVPWSLAAEAEALAAADVGLYPLAGDGWSQAKCAYKLRLYMAWGLPSVASRHGAGLEVLEAPEAGLLADDEGEWLSALVRLALDPALRRRVGARARGLALARDDHAERTRALARALAEAAVVGRARAAGRAADDTLPTARGAW